VFNLWKSVAEQRFPDSRRQAGEQKKNLARRSHGSSRIFTDADGLKSVFNLWKSVAEQRFPNSRGQAGEQKKNLTAVKKKLERLHARHLRIDQFPSV
jgi:hypothetical protein